MRILIYAHMFPPSIGGMQYSNLEIAKGLYSLGHSISVVACHNKNISKFVSNLKFPVTILPKWPFAPMYSLVDKGLFNWMLAPIYFFLFQYRIKQFKPDVALVTDETGNFFWGAWIGRKSVPYISYCSVPLIAMKEKKGNRGLLSDIKFGINKIESYFIKLFLKNSYRQSKLILCVSESTKKEIVNVFPKFAEKAFIIPRSINDEHFKNEINKEKLKYLQNKYKIKNHHFILLSVTNLNNDKGLDDAIKAISLLDKDLKEKLKFFIVGNGKAYKILEAQSEALGLKSNVILIGSVNHSETIHYYDMCDLFILPSRRREAESFGRVFVEAASRCKPSIGVREGGMIDIIEDNKMGFLVNAGDDRSIKEKIEWSMLNKRKLKEMGVIARKSAEKKYTSNTIAFQFESYLKKIVHQS